MFSWTCSWTKGTISAGLFMSRMFSSLWLKSQYVKSNIGGLQLRLIKDLIFPTEFTVLPSSPGISQLQQQLQEQDKIHPIIMINNMLMPNNKAHPR